MNKLECKCGAKFNSEREFREHYLIGKPNSIMESKYTRTTAEMVEKREIEIKDYEANHYLIDLNCD